MTETSLPSQGQFSLACNTPMTQTAPNYENGFIQAMYKAGIHFKEKIIADGIIHRFSTERKKCNKDGWYIFYGMAGAFGDWKKDIHEKWSIKNHHLANEEQEKIFEQIEKVKKAADAERIQKQEEAATRALLNWDIFAEKGESPYLINKKINPFGIRFRKNFLVIPLRDVKGKLWNRQYISPSGIKRFLLGGRKKGCFHSIGSLKNDKPIIITEGYATGASIFMATHKATVIAFDAGNLEPVIEELKKTYPRSPLLIAGDDDCWKDYNIGKEKAEKAAQKYMCSLIFPKFKDRGTKPTDFNDLHVLEGLEEVRRQIDTAFQWTTLKALSLKDLLSIKLPRREMIMGPIIPEQGLTMIHAPRGVGKTHVSLMIAHSVATGRPMFQGKWISHKPNKVLFIDGEMPLTVMQERLAKIINNNDDKIRCENNLFIITPDLQTQSITDLSTIEGQRIIEEHLKDVKLLILDNYSALCRRGRENESESWIPLQEWFLTLRRRGLSVLLIHHSNKSGAQRGTSRKEDLLDTIITLCRPKDYDPREGARFEIHYEKSRSFYGEEAAPFEAWLKEEENKFTWHIRALEDHQLDKVVELKKEGLSQRNIALETGLSPATINRRLKEAREKKLLDGST